MYNEDSSTHHEQVHKTLSLADVKHWRSSTAVQGVSIRRGLYFHLLKLKSFPSHMGADLRFCSPQPDTSRSRKCTTIVLDIVILYSFNLILKLLKWLSFCLKNSATYWWNSMTFPWLSMTTVIFHDFQAWKIPFLNSMTFQDAWESCSSYQQGPGYKFPWKQWHIIISDGQKCQEIMKLLSTPT